jgi:ketosteroid isomerase-like protein
MRAVLSIAAGALLVGLAACANSPASSGARPGAEAEVRAIEQRWVDAETRRDAAAVAELLDDQFLFVVGSRAPINKEQFVKAVPSFTSTSQVLSEQIVRIAGDTAIVTGRDALEGPGYKQSWRYTVTYVWRAGGWRALAEHMVQEDASRP